MFEVICFGKNKSSEYKDVLNEYAKRLNKDLKVIELNHQNGDKAEMIQAEEKLLSKYLETDNYKIFLDSRGREFSSEEFSKKLISIKQHKNVSFIIGGAFGFTEGFLNNADLVLSLGKMTLPHMLARTMLLEQIYRAKMIEIGHPYHK